MHFLLAPIPSPAGMGKAVCLPIPSVAREGKVAAIHSLLRKER
jgi:hypothetical protein